VSIGTVDRVLHNRGEVAEETRQKVLKIINEMDYHPNILASTLASKRAVVFSTLLPQPLSPEGYWNKPFVGVEKRISELQQYGVTLKPFTFNQANPSSFTEQAEKVLELSPDGIVMAPFFSKEANRFVTKLREKKIPFIFIDSEIKNAGQLGYIGQDSFQSGQLAGKLLHFLTPLGQPIMVIHFAREMDNQNHLAQRERGFYTWYKNNDPSRQIITMEISDTESTDWESNLKEKISQQQIAGIFVTNSKVYLAGRFIEKNGLHHLRLIGHDLLKENVGFLKRGVVDFLICQRPEEQGYNAINKLFLHVLMKNEVQNENYTSIDIITKENVDYYKDFK